MPISPKILDIAKIFWQKTFGDIPALGSYNVFKNWTKILEVSCIILAFEFIFEALIGQSSDIWFSHWSNANAKAEA